MDAAAEAKSLLDRVRHGVLSTQSADKPGYPSGSLVVYCLDAAGCPIILLSALAEHSKNIARDRRVSLTVADIKEEDVQTSPRLTMLADAAKSADPEAKSRYLTAFPASRDYAEKLDFSFYRLEPVKLRFVAGFGKILDIGPSNYLDQK